MPALAFSIDQREFRVDPFVADMRGGVVSTETIRIAGDVGSVTVSGSVDIAEEALDFTARGDLEPRILSLFVPAISVSGSATTDLRVSGSWKDPQISGQLTLADGAIRLRKLPVAIAQVNGSLILAGSDITLESLTGTIGGGTVALRGGATLSGTELGNVDISIEGDAVGLEYPPGLRSRLDLDFSLRGEPGSMLLAGSAGITSASFEPRCCRVGERRSDRVRTLARHCSRSRGGHHGPGSSTPQLRATRSDGASRRPRRSRTPSAARALRCPSGRTSRAERTRVLHRDRQLDVSRILGPASSGNRFDSPRGQQERLQPRRLSHGVRAHSTGRT